MRHQIFRVASQKRSRDYILRPFLANVTRSFSHHSSQSGRPSFGVAFDIDGVILLGHTPIGGSPRALRRLYDDLGGLKIPYVFLTNGGGFCESKRALELSEILDISILPSQVIQGHSPFKQLVNRFENELIIAVGKGEPAAVMSEYGFMNVLSIDEYSSYFDGIDPLATYKTWTAREIGNRIKAERGDVVSKRVQAAFVLSDPVDWSRDIQVLCDVLRTGGLPGRETGKQPYLYFANDDLEYQANFPTERLGMAAFRIALEAIYNRKVAREALVANPRTLHAVFSNTIVFLYEPFAHCTLRIHSNPLVYTSYGKPNPLVFKNAENVLRSLLHPDRTSPHVPDQFRTLYMVGDNPKVDIRGARQAGAPWFSILTRTGVFKGKRNHEEFPADLVVDTVEEAVDFILKREGKS